MASPTKTALQDLDDDAEEDSKSDSGSKFQGPPPASPKPRSASDSSLYSQAGQAAQQAGDAGLGAEGNNPALIGVQGLALVQRGIQMINLSFPENPGIVAALGDITGRLQALIPQLVAGSGNQGMGLMASMAQGMQPPVGVGPAAQGMPPGMPPMPPGAGPMGPPGAVPPGVPPTTPPVPVLQQ